MAAADSWEYPAQRKFDDVAPLAEVDPNDKAGKEAFAAIQLSTHRRNKSDLAIHQELLLQQGVNTDHERVIKEMGTTHGRQSFHSNDLQSSIRTISKQSITCKTSDHPTRRTCFSCLSDNTRGINYRTTAAYGNRAQDQKEHALCALGKRRI